MKKYLLILLLGGVSLFTINSCSHEKVTPQLEVEKQEAFDLLNKQIAILNLQYVDKFAPATRGRFWRWFGRFVASDLGGAAVGARGGGIGAVIGAIWGSLIFAAIDNNQSSPPEDGTYLADINDELIAFNAADSVGHFHNKIIVDIFNEKGDSVYQMSDNELKSVIIEKAEGYYGKMSKMEYARISSIMLSAGNVAAAFADSTVEDPFVVLEAELPEKIAEVQMLKVYCENLAQLTTDQEAIVSYTEAFTKLVEESDIPLESKNVLGVSVAVGGNSNLLWKESSMHLAIE